YVVTGPGFADAFAYERFRFSICGSHQVRIAFVFDLDVAIEKLHQQRTSFACDRAHLREIFCARFVVGSHSCPKCAGCAALQSLRCGVLCAKAFAGLRPRASACTSCHFAAMMGGGIRALVLRTPKLLLACSLVACFCTAAFAQIPENLYQDMHWRMIGPFRGGRTRAATGVATQPNVFYIGAVDGGVWQSNDYGRTWRPIFDSQNTQSIGAIAVAPSDPKVIYAASGECLHRPDLSVGNGVYKSEDAGKTWQHLGLRDGQQFPALAVDPHDPNRVFAAVLGHPYGTNAERGIFRSTDGGKSWTKVLYKDQNTGGYDVQ